MNMFDLQQKLDVQKWVLSEEKGIDMCGQLDYCAYCDRAEEYPCANAKLRMDAEAKKAAKAQKADAPAQAPAKKKKIVRSHEEKVALANDELLKRYQEISKEMLSYKAVTSRVSKRCDCYRAHCQFIARVFVTGKSLKIYLPLDPQDPALARYPHTDVTKKKTMPETPFSFKVNSKLAVKRAKELIAIVCANRGLKKK